MRDCNSCVFHKQGRTLDDAPSHCHDCVSYMHGGKYILPYYVPKDAMTHNPGPAPKDAPIRSIRMEIPEGEERATVFEQPLPTYEVKELDRWDYPAAPTLPAPSSYAPVQQPVDDVNHPPHYTTGGMETIEYLRAKLSPEEYRGYLKGNAMKYLSRANYKGADDKDYKKAEWYISRLIKDCL